MGNAVYGNRPVIIGFLHLVFLGFVTFYILSNLIEHDLFSRNGKVIVYPFYIFSFAIIFNETILMLRGLGILFKNNSSIYNWFLWIAAIMLLLGATLVMSARFKLYEKEKTKTVMS